MTQLEQLDTRLYVPQKVGRVTAGEVMSSSQYATLSQNLKLVFENPEVARHYLANTGVGNWTRTAVFYGGIGNEKWIEGGDDFEIIDRFNYKGQSREGSLELPNNGWVKAYRNGNEWKVWDFNENGGFARYTTQNKQEAEESFIEAGLDPRLVSKQWRRNSGNHGLVPVNRYSGSVSGPLWVSADGNFGYFGDQDGGLGGVFSSGSEQNSGKTEQKNFANSSSKTYEDGFLEAEKIFAQELRSLHVSELLEKYTVR